MRYVDNSIGSAYLPKLLGIYERELAPRVEEACARRPALIVDIGAAEGYYAIGLARRNPQAAVVAFEMEEAGRGALVEMARLNEVAGRVRICGKCEPDDLQTALAQAVSPLVICDVEGYEGKLLNPLEVPALRGAFILAEMHDFLLPGISEELQKRFAMTHKVNPIWQADRSLADFPYQTLGTTLLPKSYLHWAVSEWRPVRMSWLWMEPND